MRVPNNSASVTELMNYVAEVDFERFGKTNILTACMIFTEEVGELFKELRIFIGMPTHEKTEHKNLEDEFGDVFYLLLKMAKFCGVNPARALLNKIEKDKSKHYEVRYYGD